MAMSSTCCLILSSLLISHDMLNIAIDWLDWFVEFFDIWFEKEQNLFKSYQIQFYWLLVSVALQPFSNHSKIQESVKLVVELIMPGTPKASYLS